MKSFKYLLLIVLAVSAFATKTLAQDAAVNQALTQYLNLKNDLAADNSKGANTDAAAFAQAVSKVDAGKLNADQKAVWTKYAEKLRFDGQHISESTDIKHQREHFGSLSANMYAVVKAFKNNTVTLYQQFCPMERKSWLSETKAVKNPYLGKEMPDCGRVTETLKPGM